MSNLVTISRTHEICMGHRVVGHETSCKHLHGHNYKFTFTVQGKQLDDVGRVVDFSVVKNSLCKWLDELWDHKTLLWWDDPWAEELQKIHFFAKTPDMEDCVKSFVLVPFNPTAENIGLYLMNEIAPRFLQGHDVELVEIIVQETTKCSARVVKNT